MTDARADLLVIGAGPAGCAAGIAAARGGARVVVLDRSTFPRPKACGDAISNRAAALVDALTGQRNALERIAHARVAAAAAVFPDGSRVARSFGDDVGYIVPRLHFDDLLRRALEDAGPRLEQGVKVRRLTVRRGRIVGAEADGRRYEADAVIAADGPGSVAWTALGQPYRRDRDLAVAMTAYHQAVEFGDDVGVSEHYFEKDIAGGYGWVFPSVDGAVNIGVYQRSDRFHAHTRSLRDMLESFVGRHPERLGSSRRVGRPRAWALPLRGGLEAPGGPGVLMAGDAGNFVDPLSGEGIWQALHTGVLAAELAVDALGRSGIDRRTVRKYRLRCMRDVGVVSLMRMAVQDAMDWAVKREVYRLGAFRKVLQRGYRSDTLEVSKRVR